jgi:radical SAM superfamily enzyme YgiQ (UPF0313 family)
MAKILLIYTNTEIYPYPVPPIGLSLLAGVLEHKHTVKIFDGVFMKDKSLQQMIKEFAPDYIGFGIRNIDDITIENPHIYVDDVLEKFVRPAKEVSSVPMIGGGSGFSIYPAELMKLLALDYGIVGEGEYIFPLLIEYLEQKKDPGILQGVITKSSDLSTIKRAPYFDLKQVPFSNIDQRVVYDAYKQRSSYPVQTKRGCYHNCIYCSYPILEGRKYRVRSAMDVVDEIESVHNRHLNIGFEFVDSTFNDPPGHAEAICREIIKRKLNVKLRTMGINPGNSSKELFDLMMEAGFAQIDCTIDNASPRMIKNMGKNFTTEQLLKTASLIREYNLPTMWFLLFGGPGENEETMAENLDFIDSHINPEDMVHMTVGLRIYPKTRLYEIALEQGIITKERSMLQPVFYVSPEMGKEKLIKYVWEATRSRPNCVPSSESNPSPEMIKKAIEMQAATGLREPMFRTLLKIRRQMMEAGEM